MFSNIVNVMFTSSDVADKTRDAAFKHGFTHKGGSAEFAGPENGGPKKNKDWKMQDLEYIPGTIFSRSCIFQVLHFQSPHKGYEICQEVNWQRVQSLNSILLLKSKITSEQKVHFSQTIFPLPFLWLFFPDAVSSVAEFTDRVLRRLPKLPLPVHIGFQQRIRRVTKWPEVLQVNSRKVFFFRNSTDLRRAGLDWRVADVTYARLVDVER